MSNATPAQRAKSGNDGFIIVAVLWILAALATLVSIYAIYVTNSAIAVAASGDATIADPLVAAGVELAAYQLLGQTDEKRPAIGQFTARVGAAQLTIVFQTEAARIDLNQAPKELLVGLLRRLRRLAARCRRLCRSHHRLAHANRGAELSIPTRRMRSIAARV